MKLQEPKEISKEDYTHIKRHLIEKAEKVRALHKKLGWRHITVGYYLSPNPVPCRHNKDAGLRIDPRTGKALRWSKVPPKFNSYLNTILRGFPLHFSPAGCQNLKPFYSIVECLLCNGSWDESGETYYYGVHRVGECPWKVAP